MKKFIANILIIIAIACAGAAVAWCVTHDEEQEAFTQQQEAVQAFYSALTTGDWDGATAVCDSAQMADYIENFRQVWSMTEKQDSAIMGIAKEILAGTGLTFLEQEMVSEEVGSMVFRLQNGESLSKTKMAELKLEDGRWKITEITAKN